ncbi:MAG: hypothetical protein QME47_05705, partial [Candidatus Thermoplasmatota archaeon]|nr:hypothetical protein [Candidatus Thermoplasmatota archaeon]
KKLNKTQVKYLIVCGLASILYGVPRTTADIDITVMPTMGNLKKVITALKELGLRPEIDDITEIFGVGGTSFTNDWEIDMLADMELKDFEQAWENKTIVEFKGVELYIIPKALHIATLKRLGRAQNREDLRYLEE